MHGHSLHLIQPSFYHFFLHLLAPGSGDYDFSGFDVSCVAGYLKKCLREFPDPLIPIQWYDRFLEASRMYPFCMA